MNASLWDSVLVFLTFENASFSLGKIIERLRVQLLALLKNEKELVFVIWLDDLNGEI